MNIKKRSALLFKALFPVALSLALVFLLWTTGTDLWKQVFYLAGVYVFTPVGMIAAIPFALKMGMSIPLAVSLLIFMDLITAMLIVWNLDLLRKVPGLGKPIERSEIWGKKQLKKNPRLKALAFVGIFVFVMIPVYGSGTVLGCMVGKLIGMKDRRIILATVLGSSVRLMLTGLIAGGVLHFL